MSSFIASALSRATLRVARSIQSTSLTEELNCARIFSTIWRAYRQEFRPCTGHLSDMQYDLATRFNTAKHYWHSYCHPPTIVPVLYRCTAVHQFCYILLWWHRESNSNSCRWHGSDYRSVVPHCCIYPNITSLHNFQFSGKYLYRIWSTSGKQRVSADSMTWGGSWVMEPPPPRKYRKV